MGAAVLGFHYRLSSADAVVDRSYIKVNAQFGLETEWRPAGGPFALDLVLLGCPPISPPLPQCTAESCWRHIGYLNMLAAS